VITVRIYEENGWWWWDVQNEFFRATGGRQARAEAIACAIEELEHFKELAQA
jgi:hypothetical protein